MIQRLIEIISRLRAPDGCPWDREQTPQSVKKYIVEETYELIDAIDQDHAPSVQEELGDVLFMVLFVGYMYEEKAPGFIEGAIELARKKMVRRHPHIFGNAVVSDPSQVTANWQEIKEEEARSRGKDPSILGEIPRALPALQRALRLSERASRVGFDWPDVHSVMDKLKEEERELEEAMASGNGHGKVEEEIGDLLFTISNIARHLEVNPEDALHKATLRFESRFRRMEGLLRRSGVSIKDAPMDVMDRAWEKVKKDQSA